MKIEKKKIKNCRLRGKSSIRSTDYYHPAFTFSFQCTLLFMYFSKYVHCSVISSHFSP